MVIDVRYLPRSEVQIWPVVGTFLVSMFLQGLQAAAYVLLFWFDLKRTTQVPSLKVLSFDGRQLIRILCGVLVVPACL
jgi:hypothetical protein